MIHNLFPIPISVVKPEIDLEKLKSILYKIWEEHELLAENSRYDLMKGNSLTTHTVNKNLHNLPELKFLKDILLKHAEDYAKVLKYIVKPEIVYMWSNLYKKGSSVETHNHAPMLITSTLYVKKPSDSSNIFFKHPLDLVLKYSPVHFTDDNYIHLFEEEIELEEGDLVLFPGYLSHKTKPSMSDEDRITITADFHIGVPL